MKNNTIRLFVSSSFFLILFSLLNPIYACSFITGYTSIEIECGIQNADSSYFTQSEIKVMGETITLDRSELSDTGIQINIYSDKAEELGRLTPGVKSVLKNELDTTLSELCTVDLSYLQDNLVDDLESRLDPGVYEPDGAFYIFETEASKARLMDELNQLDECRYPVYETQDQWIIGKMEGTREYCTNRGLCGSPQINAGDYLPFLLTNIDQQTFPYLVKHLLHLTPLLIFAISVPASLFYMFKTKRFLAYFIISVLTTPLTFFVLILLNYSWIIDSDFFNTKNEMLMSPFLLGSVLYLLWVWWREKAGKGKKGMS